MTEFYFDDFLTVDPETENYINSVLDDSNYDWDWLNSPATTATTATSETTTLTTLTAAPVTTETVNSYSPQNEFEVFQNLNLILHFYIAVHIKMTLKQFLSCVDIEGARPGGAKNTLTPLLSQ